MKVVSAEEMRELDRRTIEEYETSGDVLMDRAGEGVAMVVRRLAEVTGLVNPVVQLLAGRGNNGGDAYTAARHLKTAGFEVDVLLAGSANQVKGDALKHLSLMKGAGVTLQEVETKEDWEDAQAAPSRADILVDGLLGTGATGPARGPVVGAITYINTLASDALVVAIDIPSGLDSHSGVAHGDAVRADVTVTMGLPKRGLVQSAAADYVGAVEVVDIGIPPDFVDEAAPADDCEMVYVTDLRPLFPRRARASHKGDYGHVLLIGGAVGYSGAIRMAAATAVRSGVGLVTVLTPERVMPIVAGGVPEAMVFGAGASSDDSLPAELDSSWMERLATFDAVLVGPGLTRHKHSATLVRELLSRCTVPLVLDADAISVLAGEPERIRKAPCPVVITPHPGELGRLLGEEVSAIQADRFAAALQTTELTGATVVLKGAGTVIAQSGLPVSINMSGNPGMAAGGSGDVLAGLLTGLLGQGLAPYDASRAAVHLHGRAGDMAAWHTSQPGIVAGDLIKEIPFIFRELSIR